MAPVKPIWNAQTMSSRPGPKNTSAAANTLATQGPTPARTMIVRIRATTARCAATTTAR